MTKDDIIKLAREAGFLIDTHAQQYQPNCILSTYGLIDENLERFANLAAAAEREACAQIVDDFGDEWMCDSHMLSKEIRARGNT